MSRPLWMVDLLKRAFPGRFWMARATRFRPFGALVDRTLFHEDDVLYLPPDAALRRSGVIRVDVGRPVEPGEQLAAPSQVLAHFIEKAGFLWIMHRCLCRDSAGCKDYPIDMGCLFLGEAARGINPALGRPVTKAEALEHMRKTSAAGLVHLIGRNKLDTVWLGIGPGERLMTVCHCCPCCCLWRVLPDLAPEISRKVSAMPGVSVAVTDRCIGCGTCTHGVCFVDALVLIGGRAEIGLDCRACGRCAEACPQGAIEIRIDDPSVLQNAIARIEPLVDVR